MKRAIALATHSILNSPMKAWMEGCCERHGVELKFHNVMESAKEYAELFREHSNVITWNCRMPYAWMKKWGNNVLYLDNSLLNQRTGVFMDQGGLFSNSNLCRLKTWQHDYTVDLDAFTKQNFEWGAMAGGMKNGPILVCLQSSKDSNLIQQFPLGDREADKVNATLAILREHLPKGPDYIIRPHPRFLDEWNSVERELREDWRVSTEGQFTDVLPECSAMVTVNSTCASEAVTLGIPVATLGIGTFTDSGATLECARDPKELRKIHHWKPDIKRCTAYAKAILGRHFMPYETKGQANIEMERWLANL